MSFYGSSRQKKRAEKRASDRAASRYEKNKAKAAQQNLAASLAGRDIGEIPPVKDKKRREACRLNFRLFCETYFKEQFYLEWSDDQLEILASVEAAVLRGELLAFAMPRGSGKSAIIRVAALWAILYGHRQYVVIVAASEPHAIRNLGSIKNRCERNKLLLADFPEAIHPVKKLGRITNKAKGQLYCGEATEIKWSEDEIQFAYITGAKSSGGNITARGITSAIRGMSIARSDTGREVRPDLVLVDDPQTKQSAKSTSQVAELEEIFKGDILGLAGPDVNIAGLVAVTVIHEGDLSDRLLNRKLNPSCQGRRMKMVYQWPTETELWVKYEELRKAGQESGEGTGAADRLFKANFDRMIAGCRVGWPARMRPGEIHAIQTAFNLKIDRGEAVFAAEYQNEPLAKSERATTLLSAVEIANKINRKPRGIIPLGCQYLTMMTDCQGEALYWMVAAWEENFTGYVIDYGCFPDQRRNYFTLREITKKLSDVCNAKSPEGRLMEGLRLLHDQQFGRKWEREDGSVMRIERALVDAGYLPDAVFQFCHESGYQGIIMPSRGFGVKARQTPFSMYSKKPGDRVGHYWRVPTTAKKRIIRHVEMDVNYWKSRVHSQLAVPLGDAGSLSFFGDKPEAHRLIADHMLGEFFVTRSEKGRTVDEWESPPSKPDNHWLDDAVGCAVGASMLGAKLQGSEGWRAMPRKRVSFAELQRQRRAGK
jgi:ABC-type dipeptide/oligopeptide/nickel transport system ATPase subunit